MKYHLFIYFLASLSFIACSKEKSEQLESLVATEWYGEVSYDYTGGLFKDIIRVYIK